MYDECRGYFPSVDYMVDHNAYYFIYESNLSEYKKNTSYACAQSFTTIEEAWFPIEITRKFPDYKAKGIPIES